MTIEAKCTRCNDAGWVGGFLPAPCDDCRPTEVAQLRAQLTSATQRAERAEQERDEYHTGTLRMDEHYARRLEQIAADRDSWRARAEAAESNRRASDSECASTMNDLTRISASRNAWRERAELEVVLQERLRRERDTALARAESAEARVKELETMWRDAEARPWLFLLNAGYQVDEGTEAARVETSLAARVRDIERDTAERIAAWLDEQKEARGMTLLTQANVEHLASDIRAFAWRENGGGK